MYNMKKIFFAIMMVALAACNNSTETSVSDSLECDSTCVDSTMCDSTVAPVVDTTKALK